MAGSAEQPTRTRRSSSFHARSRTSTLYLPESEGFLPPKMPRDRDIRLQDSESVVVVGRVAIILGLRRILSIVGTRTPGRPNERVALPYRSGLLCLRRRSGGENDPASDSGRKELRMSYCRGNATISWFIELLKSSVDRSHLAECPGTSSQVVRKVPRVVWLFERPRRQEAILIRRPGRTSSVLVCGIVAGATTSYGSRSP
jgi:hypothetical protein